LAVEPLTGDRVRGAARVLADAFLDDPGWVDVGPDNRRSRWKYTFRTCHGALKACDRWGGPSWCTVEDGEVTGVLACVDPGRWPVPELRLLAMMAPGAIAAGPAPLWRGLNSTRLMEKNHPRYEHFYVWMFGVSPAHQRGGRGRALMANAVERADAAGVPAYLETGNPDNLPYYGSHGYEVIGELPLPRGAPMWFMERPARPA
jgi:GNAT superfamily N-acetyltransferase